jgi:hypothetical protein
MKRRKTCLWSLSTFPWSWALVLLLVASRRHNAISPWWDQALLSYDKSDNKQCYFSMFKCKKLAVIPFQSMCQNTYHVYLWLMFRIIHNLQKEEQTKNYWHLSKLLKIANHQVISTNAQHKMYFCISIFLHCWNSEKLNLKLLNFFSINK